jgi:SAM-dependent methyltransferase
LIDQHWVTTYCPALCPKPLDGEDVKMEMASTAFRNEKQTMHSQRGRVRESGMPPQQLWASFFDVDRLLDEIELPHSRRTLELGAGYGLFTFPLAKRCQHLTAVEIDASLCESLRQRSETTQRNQMAIANLDFCDQNALASLGCFDLIVLFNILHMQFPVEFLTSLRNVATSDCRVHVLHWRTDIDTPRGPSPAIRSTPEQCVTWFESSGFTLVAQSFPSAAPFHFAQQYRLNSLIPIETSNENGSIAAAH